MVRKKWSVLCVGVLVAGLTLTSLVSARGGHGGRGGHGHSPFRILRSLTLTDTQQTAIDAIKTTHRTNLGSLKTEMRATREDVLRLLLGEGDVAEEDFATLKADMLQIHTDLFDEFLSMGLKIRAELTDEQLAEALAKLG